MFTINDEEVCRSCGGPKLEKEKELVQCSRCYEASTRIESKDELFNFMARDLETFPDTFRDALKELPEAILRPLCVLGLKIVVTPQGEEIEQPEASVKQRFLTQLAEDPKFLEFIRMKSPELAEVVEQVVNHDGTCKGCGKHHKSDDDNEGKSFAHYSSRDRFLRVSHDIEPTLFKHCLITTMLISLKDTVKDTAQSMADIQNFRAKLLEESPEWDDLSVDAKVNRMLEVCVSHQSVGGWDDFLAQCMLAYLGQNPDCSSERLRGLYPDAWNFAKITLDRLSIEVTSLLERAVASFK